MKLRTILRQIEKDALKEVRSLDYVFVETVLKSSKFTQLEREAVGYYYQNIYQAKPLKESFFTKLNLYASGPSQLREGIIDWLKQKGQAAADAVVGALQSGGEKLKQMWGNLKEILQVIVSKIREGFIKMAKWIWTQASAALNSKKDRIKQIIEKHVSDTESPTGSAADAQKKHGPIAQEAKQLNSVVGYLGEWFVDKVVSPQAEWSKDVLAGKGMDSLKEEYASLLSQSDVVRVLAEAGDHGHAHPVHPEDLIKNKGIKKIAKFLINSVKWVLNPIGQVAQKVIKYTGSKGFQGLSWISKKLGGPGVFEFAIFGAILAEMAEIWDGFDKHYLEHATEMLIHFLAGFIPGANILLNVCHGVHYFCIFYAGAVIVLTILQELKIAKAPAKNALVIASGGGADAPGASGG